MNERITEVLNLLHGTPVVVLNYAAAGSTYICGEGKDIDMVLHVQDFETAAFELCRAGFTVEGIDGDYPQDEFISLRKGDVNVLLVDSENTFRAWKTASEVCRFSHRVLCPLSKQHRIALHRVVMGGYTTEQAVAGMEECN